MVESKKRKITSGEKVKSSGKQISQCSPDLCEQSIVGKGHFEENTSKLHASSPFIICPHL